MKTILLLTISLLSSLITAFAQPFSLQGTFTAIGSGEELKVYLMKMAHLHHFFTGTSLVVIDSSAVDAKGSFSFTNGAIIEPNTFYRVHVVIVGKQNAGSMNMVGSNENFAFFLLGPHSQLSFRTSPQRVGQDMVLTNADNANTLIRQLNNVRKRHNELIDTLVKKRGLLDPNMPFYSDSLAGIKEQISNAAATTNYYEDLRAFADTVSDPYVSLLAMQYLPDDTYHSFFETMNKRYRQVIPLSRYTSQFGEALHGASGFLHTGSKAPSVSLPDDNGRTVSLAGMAGSYVLVDFWASWCPPCRQEAIRYITPLHKKYSHKGFNVLSVSLDINRQNWLSAVEDDGVGIWPQVSDLRGLTSPVAESYRVWRVPYNYIIDKQGVIIAQDLHGAELERFINKLFP